MLALATTRACYNDQASDLTKALLSKARVGHIRLAGVRAALDSLVAILATVRADNADLFRLIGTAGMLCVRHRRPTSGAVSRKLSNHSWGTAVDVTIDGDADPKPDGKVQLGIALLVPYFNAEGWYSGSGFKDDTHFEVADETMHRWAAEGRFAPR